VTGESADVAFNQAVDIILPTNHRPHTIAYSIESALAQTHRDFTLHVIGDGCDEATERIARSRGDSRVIFLHRFPKAMGFGYVHRNDVLSRTTAPYVAYLTDDDLWFPDHLANGLARLRERSLDLVAFRSAHVQYPDISLYATVSPWCPWGPSRTSDSASA
jgi:glycosyltransferase involved in cell wall biosynthesis